MNRQAMKNKCSSMKKKDKKRINVYKEIKKSLKEAIEIAKTMNASINK